LWQEGKLVEVSGKVRVRGDRISINCTDAYKIDSVVSVPTVEIDPSSGERVQSVPESKMNGKAVSYGEPDQGPSVDARGLSQTKSVKYLNVRLQETGQPDVDLQLLEDIRNLMLENQGSDEVKWEIATNGSIVQMEWSIIRVSTIALEAPLRAMVGVAGQITIL
jgi:hypothetical protein